VLKMKLGGVVVLGTRSGCFRRALAVARKQRRRGFELRAAVGLARLLSDRGRRDEARDLLATLYGWFTEGFDTPHVKEAEALLVTLDQ
jgi:predicted ATPase